MGPTTKYIHKILILIWSFIRSFVKIFISFVKLTQGAKSEHFCLFLGYFGVYALTLMCSVMGSVNFSHHSNQMF